MRKVQATVIIAVFSLLTLFQNCGKFEAPPAKSTSNTNSSIGSSTTIPTTPNPGPGQPKLENKWYPMSLPNLTARIGFSAVWTGTHVIVFGGQNYANGNNAATFFNDGAIYNPATDQWKPISNVNAPSARAFHSAVWTGTKMIVWGGYGGASYSGKSDGAEYDPSSDLWSPIASTGAPIDRDVTYVPGGAFLSGNKMIACCWGTSDPGGIYDTNANSWSPLPTKDYPRWFNQGGMGVLVGSKYIWFGGYNSDLNPAQNDGGIFDLNTGNWTNTSLSGAPQGRAYGLAVSHSNKAFFVGGIDYKMTSPGNMDQVVPADFGGIFDPNTNSWTILAMPDKVNFPNFQQGRVWNTTSTAVSTPYGLAVFSPNPSSTPFFALYDENAKVWSPLSTAGAPSQGVYSYYISLWTGSGVVFIGTVSPNSTDMTITAGIFK